MKKSLHLLLDILGVVFKEKWENIGAIIGALIAFPTLPLHFLVLMGVFALALLIDLARFIFTAGRDLREKHIPLLVVVGRDDDEIANTEGLVVEAMAPYGFNPQDWDTRYRIELRDLTLARKSGLPTQEKQWNTFARQFGRLISKVKGLPQVRGRKIFHVFLYSPAALAAGLGAVAGTKSPLVLHHYQGGRYHKVMDFENERLTDGAGVRIVRAPVKPPFRYITVEAPENVSGGCLLVVVQLSSPAHDPLAAVENLATERGGSVAVIRNTYDGLLKLDSDWLQMAREVYTVISGWTAAAPRRQIELFINCPLPIAFALGMALGFQSQVTVQNWFHAEGRYYPVIALHHLE